MQRSYLCAEIGNLGRSWIVDSDTLDTSQSDVFSWLNQLCQESVSDGRSPISTPSPFNPTMRTFDVAIFFMAVGQLCNPYCSSYAAYLRVPKHTCKVSYQSDGLEGR